MECYIVTKIMKMIEKTGEKEHKKLYNIIKEGVITDRTDRSKCWHECLFHCSYMHACYLFSGNTEHARCQSCIDIFR